MLPEPITLESSDLGVPLYSISPDPVTLALRSPLQTTATSPEPATFASTSVTCKSKPWKSPEPVTPAFKSLVLPFSVKSPEPECYKDYYLFSFHF